VNRNTVNRFYLALRVIIAGEMEKAAPLHGEVEVDESYFGGRRKGKRGRGAAGKVPVFARWSRLHAPDSQRQGEDADADPRVPGGA